jgi:hypothetical protein
MTTIAANLKEMCADSAMSWDAEFMLVEDKLEIIDGEIVGCSGHEPDIQKFLKWFRNQTPETPEFSDDDNKGFSALVLNGKGLWCYGNTCSPSRITTPHAALGSGGMAANAAMALGKSPRVAVEIACTLDKNSKLPVQRITLAQAMRRK